MHGLLNECMVEQMDVWKDRWMDECMDRWMYGCMDVWIDEWTYGLMNGCMVGRVFLL